MKKTFTTLCFAITGIVFSQTSPQTYTTPGLYTFTVPASVSTLTVEIVGGGGSGGGNGTGGGGGGGYSKGVLSVTPGSTLAVKVGTFGLGAAAGTTSVGTISATGGANGINPPTNTVGGGGAAGVGSGGSIANFNGGVGGGGYYTYFGGGGGGAGGPAGNGSNGGNVVGWTGNNCLQPGGSGGTGGGAPGGNGGKGSGFTDNSCNNNDPAVNGGNFGGGGGGGNGNSGPASNGAGGYCQISWLSCALPSAPTNTTPIANQTVCANYNTTLSVAGTGTINWYSTPTSTVVYGSGSTYSPYTPAPGTYTYYAASTNTCGEGPRTAVSVSVIAGPNVSIASSASLICAGQNATLTATGANSYTWGTSATTSVIVVSPTITTNYLVNGTGSNGCVSSYTLWQNVSPCTGVNNMAANETERIHVYPNPSKGDITISVASEMHLIISNSVGQTIRTVNVNASNNYKVTVSDLPEGIYFITDSKNKNNPQKIIISK